MATTFVACSDIAEDERLIYVKPPQVNRAVLIEDFTGQRCVNCPVATDEISRLVEQYGEDAVIAVGIHSGPLGFTGNSKYEGLKTEVGDTYYYHWGVTQQPMGMVNRVTGPSLYTTWAGTVRTELERPSTLSLSVENTYDEASRTVTIDAKAFGTNGTTNGKLQVWLLEDSIVSIQYMPGGGANTDYVHNHVFRATVNGTWGEDVTVEEGQTTEKKYTYTLPEKWNADKMAVVAFVYNDSGVQQVTKKSVKESESSTETEK